MGCEPKIRERGGFRSNTTSICTNKRKTIMPMIGRYLKTSTLTMMQTVLLRKEKINYQQQQTARTQLHHCTIKQQHQL